MQASCIAIAHRQGGSYRCKCKASYCMSVFANAMSPASVLFLEVFWWTARTTSSAGVMEGPFEC